MAKENHIENCRKPEGSMFHKIDSFNKEIEIVENRISGV